MAELIDRTDRQHSFREGGDCAGESIREGVRLQHMRANTGAKHRSGDGFVVKPQTVELSCDG